jgi:hypothetical protein
MRAPMVPAPRTETFWMLRKLSPERMLNYNDWIMGEMDETGQVRLRELFEF